MHPLILIAAALVLPLVWGWLVYRIMKRCWPANHSDRRDHVSAGDETARVDFQI